MSLSENIIATHPAASLILRERAKALLALHVSNPRSAGIFATHQRWLLAHIGLAAQFENARATGRAGMYASQVADAAQKAGVSSRNTAEAFLREMTAYGFVAASADPEDQRVRWLVVTPHALADVAAWLFGNLGALDAFDGGGRVNVALAASDALARIQPVAAQGFLESPDIRRPGPAFAVFDAVDEGGAVLDRLFSTHDSDADAQGRHTTAVSALRDFGDNLRLSRSHLTRKLREAEDLGVLGWTGARGRSKLWVSRDFVADYVKRQAAELASIERGYQAAFADSSG